MEMCDVFDASGTQINKTVARGTTLLQGEYYLVVHVWIRDETGKYLIQKRAPHLSTHPNIWATTAGYVMTGEESLSGAIREVEEELGIQLESTALKRLNQIASGNLLQDIWFAEVLQDTVGIPTLCPDVTDWKWASKAELNQMINQRKFFGYSYFDQLPD